MVNDIVLTAEERGQPVVVRLKFYDSKSPKWDFYTCRGKSVNGHYGFDYLAYMERGADDGKTMDRLDGEDEHPTMSSLFGKDGLLTKTQKAELREALRQTESSVGDLVVSIEHDLGVSKWKTWADAHRTLCKVLPKFFRDARFFPDNMEWYASFHENTDNPHVHVGFFERKAMIHYNDKKEAEYHKPLLVKKVFKTTVDNLKANVVASFSGVPFDLASYRDSLVSGSRSELYRHKDDRELRELIKDIYENLPRQGRIGYASKDIDHIRDKVDKVTEFIMSNNEEMGRGFDSLKEKLMEHDSEIEANMKTLKDKNPDLKVEDFLLFDKVTQDIYKRCGNMVLKHVLTAKTGDVGHGLLKKSSHLTGYARQIREEKGRKDYLYRNLGRLQNDMSNNAQAVFEEYQRSLRKAHFERLVAEGWIDINGEKLERVD